MKYSSLKTSRQQGASLIMFLLMIPVLIGFMVLSIEGGRYLRTKSAVADAAEVATLAISARASQSEEGNQKLAESYIQTLLPEARDISVSVSKAECSELDDCNPEWGERAAFVQYNTSASATFDSWFPKSEGNGLGFNKEVTLGNSASVRKFQGNGGAVDVVFAADFSGGMRCEWGAEEGANCPQNQVNENSKVEVLKRVLSEVAQNIEYMTKDSSQKNTMAMIPFSSFSGELNEDRPGGNQHDEYCRVKQDRNADPAETFRDMFVEKGCSTTRIKDAPYHSIPPTTNASELIEPLMGFQASGATAIYGGVIRAAKYLLDDEEESKNSDRISRNQRRLIIVMSDGIDNGSVKIGNEDVDFTKHHNALTEWDYCGVIREKLNNQTVNGQSVESRIVGIGFDYDIETNVNLKKMRHRRHVRSRQ